MVNDALSELISKKTQQGEVTLEQIRVFGTNWCGDCRRARRVLDERQVDYEWNDIDQDKTAESFVKQTNQGHRSVPTIIFPDESILVEPSNQELIKKLQAFGY
jgi:mycoredoxin